MKDDLFSRAALHKILPTILSLILYVSAISFVGLLLMTYQPFDSSSPDMQMFTDEDGTSYTIRPASEPPSTFHSLGLENRPVDDHCLETYNRIASRFMGEPDPPINVDGGMDFWRVIRTAKPKTDTENE